MAKTIYIQIHRRYPSVERGWADPSVPVGSDPFTTAEQAQQIDKRGNVQLVFSDPIGRLFVVFGSPGKLKLRLFEEPLFRLVGGARRVSISTNFISYVL